MSVIQATHRFRPKTQRPITDAEWQKLEKAAKLMNTRVTMALAALRAMGKV